MKNTLKIIGILFLSLLLSCSSDDDSPSQQQYSLDPIQGDWYRVGGNYPEYNGMLVNIANNTGTVIIPAGSSFNNGDIKWKDIEGVDTNKYTHQELGSDSQYYDAAMRLGIDDTLRIIVGNAGAGNEQKWVRQFSELNDCTPYQVGDFSDSRLGTWDEVNEIDKYPGLLPAVADAGGGYYTVLLTNDSGIVPGLTIRVSGDTTGVILNGSAAGTDNTEARKVSFLAHPGISYDVDVEYTSYVNVNHPVNYTIEWTFTGKMDCYEANDYIGEAKSIPKNQTIEAYAITGYTKNSNISGDPQTFDYYKVVVFEPAKLKMELQQVPSTVNLNVKIFTPDGTQIIADRELISGGAIPDDGSKYSSTTNRVLNPGTYIISVEVGGSRKTKINYFVNNETIPDHWETPYKFKVTTVQ